MNFLIHPESEMAIENDRFEKVVEILEKRRFKKRVAIAKYLDMSPTQLGNYTSGRSSFGRKMLLKLESAGISSEWIANGIGEMFADNDAGRKLAAEVGAPPTGKAPAVAEGGSDSEYVQSLLRNIDALSDKVKELEVENRTLWAVIESGKTKAVSYDEIRDVFKLLIEQLQREGTLTNRGKEELREPPADNVEAQPDTGGGKKPEDARIKTGGFDEVIDTPARQRQVKS